jgi:hypothetical protein
LVLHRSAPVFTEYSKRGTRIATATAIGIVTVVDDIPHVWYRI